MKPSHDQVGNHLQTDEAEQSPRPLMAQRDVGTMVAARPFNIGAGGINMAQTLDPGLERSFAAMYREYKQFLSSVTGVDEATVQRAVGRPAVVACVVVIGPQHAEHDDVQYVGI